MPTTSRIPQPGKPALPALPETKTMRNFRKKLSVVRLRTVQAKRAASTDDIRMDGIEMMPTRDAQ